MGDATIGGRLLQAYVEAFQRRANALLAGVARGTDDEDRVVAAVLASKDLRAAFEHFAVVNRKYADAEVQAVLSWRLRLLRLAPSARQPHAVVSSLTSELAADAVVVRACLHVVLLNDTWQHHPYRVRPDVGLAFLSASTASDLTEFLASRARFWSPQATKDVSAPASEGRARLVGLLLDAVGQLSRGRFDVTYRAPVAEMQSHVQKSQSLQGKNADKLLPALMLLRSAYPPLAATGTQAQVWVEFLELIARIARKTHKNSTVKRAICEAMTHLLAPVAAYRPFHTIAATPLPLPPAGGGMSPPQSSDVWNPIPVSPTDLPSDCDSQGAPFTAVSPPEPALKKEKESLEGGGRPPLHQVLSRASSSETPGEAEEVRKMFLGDAAKGHLLTLYDVVEGWSKKKYLSAALPLQTAILCAHPTLFHSERLSALFDTVLKHLSDERDKKIRSLCLECALHVLGHAIVYGDPSQLPATPPRYVPNEGGAQDTASGIPTRQGAGGTALHFPLPPATGSSPPDAAVPGEAGPRDASAMLACFAEDVDVTPASSPQRSPLSLSERGLMSFRSSGELGGRVGTASARPPMPHRKQFSKGSCGSDMHVEFPAASQGSPRGRLTSTGSLGGSMSVNSHSARRRSADVFSASPLRDSTTKRIHAVFAAVKTMGRRQVIGNGAVTQRWYALCVDAAVLVCRTLPAVGLQHAVVGLLPTSADAKDVYSENTLVALYALLATAHLAHHHRPQGHVEEHGIPQGPSMPWWALGAPYARDGKSVRLRSPYGSFKAPSPLAGVLWPTDRGTSANLNGVWETGAHVLLDTSSLCGAAVATPQELFDALGKHADEASERLGYVLTACEKEHAPAPAGRAARMRPQWCEGGEKEKPSLHVFRVALLASVFISPAQYSPAEYFALLARLACHPQAELRDTVGKTVLPQIMFLRPALIAPLVGAVADALLLNADDLENAMGLLKVTAKLLGLLAAACGGAQQQEALPPLVRELIAKRRSFAPLPAASAFETKRVAGSGEHWAALEAACIVYLAVPNMEMRKNAQAVLYLVGNIAAAAAPDAARGAGEAVPVPPGEVCHAMRTMRDEVHEAERAVTATILHCRATGGDWSESREHRRVAGFTLRRPHEHTEDGDPCAEGAAAPEAFLGSESPKVGGDVGSDHLTHLVLYTPGWGFCLGALVEVVTWSGRMGEKAASVASHAIATKFDRLLAKASALDFTHEKKTHLDATPDDRKVLELTIGYACVMAAGCGKRCDATLAHLAAMLRSGVQDIADTGLVGYALLPKVAARAALDSLRSLDDELRARARKGRPTRQQWLTRGHLFKAAFLVLQKTTVTDWGDAASAVRLADWVDEHVESLLAIPPDRLAPFDRLILLRAYADLLSLLGIVARLLHRHDTVHHASKVGTRAGKRPAVKCSHHIDVGKRRKWTAFCLRLHERPPANVRVDVPWNATSVGAPHSPQRSRREAVRQGLSQALTSFTADIDASWEVLRDVIRARARNAVVGLMAGPLLHPPDIAWVEDSTTAPPSASPLPSAIPLSPTAAEASPSNPAHATMLVLTYPALMVFLHLLLDGDVTDQTAAEQGLRAMIRCNASAPPLVRATALLALHRCGRVAKLHLIALAHACTAGGVVPRPCIPNVLAAVLCGATDADEEVVGAAWTVMQHVSPHLRMADEAPTLERPPRFQDAATKQRRLSQLAEGLPEAGAVLVSLARERLPLFDQPRQLQYLSALTYWSALIRLGDSAEVDELLELTEAYYPGYPAVLQALWDGLSVAALRRLLGRVEERCLACIAARLEVDTARGDGATRGNESSDDMTAHSPSHHGPTLSQDIPSAIFGEWETPTAHRKKHSAEELHASNGAASASSNDNTAEVAKGAPASASAADLDAAVPVPTEEPWGKVTVVLALLATKPTAVEAVLQAMSELLAPHPLYHHRCAVAVVYAAGVLAAVNPLEVLPVLTSLLHAVVVVAVGHPIPHVSRQARDVLATMLSMCVQGPGSPPVLPIISAARRRLADLLVLWDADGARPPCDEGVVRVVCASRLIGAAVDASWAAQSLVFVGSPALSLQVKTHSLAIYTTLTAKTRRVRDFQALLCALVQALTWKQLTLAGLLCDALSDIVVQMAERGVHRDAVWGLMALISCREAGAVVEACGRICVRCLPSRISPDAFRGQHAHRLTVLSRAALAQLFLVPTSTHTVLVDVIVQIIASARAWGCGAHLPYTLVAALLPELCARFATHCIPPHGALPRLAAAFAEGPLAAVLRAPASTTDLLHRATIALADEFWGGAQLRDAEMGEFYLHLVHSAGSVAQETTQWVLLCLAHFLLSPALARVGTSATAMAPLFSVLPAKVVAESAQPHVARCLSLAVLRDRPTTHANTLSAAPPVMMRDKKATAKAAALSIGWLIRHDSRIMGRQVELASLRPAAGERGRAQGEADEGNNGWWAEPPASPWRAREKDGEAVSPLRGGGAYNYYLPAGREEIEGAGVDDLDDRLASTLHALNTSHTVSDFGELSAADSPLHRSQKSETRWDQTSDGSSGGESDEEEVVGHDATPPPPHAAVRSLLLVRKGTALLLLVSPAHDSVPESAVEAIHAWARTAYPGVEHVYVCPEVWTYANGLLLQDSALPRTIAVLHRYRHVIRALATRGRPPL
eukprot:TRINITY_DN14378_c0_g1_i1.p1 TRINITY_DN14378_c0_g1~~TRINITY_DN14378_c0_g1_i1.p1  ORF type:complete len:2644 (+),score=587.47 TRINITY_DN14378_c0_g1_i1:138-8069(+)